MFSNMFFSINTKKITKLGNIQQGHDETWEENLCLYI